MSRIRDSGPLSVKDRGLPESAILLVDNTPSHPDVNAHQSDDGKISCVYLPPSTTSLIQPVDQVILENIKHRYKLDLRLLNDDVGTLLSFQRH